MISELDNVLAQVNEIYDAIGFPRAQLPRDRVFGVMEDDAIIALGRMQHWTDDVVEVGGFWVREDRRGAGLARQMVTHVLALLPEGPSVWCIAFDHLVPFYESLGMTVVAEGTQIPDPILAKIDLCCSMLLDGRPVRTALLRWR